jgi:hypothetical protein
MSTFPALAPTTRTYTPGSVPYQTKQSTSGTQYGFRRGNRRISQTLELTFSHLTQANMLLIKDHYYDRDGTFDLFYLTAAIWGDYVTPPVNLISDFAWKYVSPPTITDVSYDRFDVAVTLETIPIDVGDVVFNAGLAAATPARTYILNGGLAAALPAREYVIGGLGAQ